VESQRSGAPARTSHSCIRSLGTTLKVIDIIVIPALFALLALAFGAWRRRRPRSLPAAEPRP